MSTWDLLRKAWSNRESKASKTASATAPTWQTPPPSGYKFEKAAREAYGGNEVFYACVEEIATSAAEPKVIAFNGKVQLESHEIIDLLEHPNPFMSRGQYVGGMVLMRSLHGNHFTEIVKSRAQLPVELWSIRPDRMRVVPHPVDTISHYEFKFGPLTVNYPIDEIGHYKTKNPLDHFYGMPPVQVLLSRIDTDNFAREFTKAFFYNAAVPSGLLTFKTALQDEERSLIRRAFNRGFAGPQGWHNTLVAEENEAHYQPMGMAMGQRGIAYPDLDEIEEARIAMVMGVPLTLIGARLGMNSSSYANRVSDRESLWDETVVPILREIEDEWNRWLVPLFPGVTRVAFDLSTIEAFAEETDAIHTRVREDVRMGVISLQRAWKLLGQVEEPAPDELFLVPSNMIPVKWSDLKEANMPKPAQQGPEPDSNTAQGSRNGNTQPKPGIGVGN